MLAAGAVLSSIGLAMLAMAPGLAMYTLGWLVLGVGMGAGLYDAAFACVGRLYGQQARGVISLVTLYGGFASTVAWPVSALLVGWLGWRGTCGVYAVVNLLVVAPLYLYGIPRAIPAGAHHGTAPVAAVFDRRQRIAFWLLAVNFTLSAVLTTVIGVHLLSILQDRGLSLAAAVALGVLIGPCQVAARVAEMLLGRRHHPVWTLLASVTLTAVGLMLVWGAPALIAAGLVLYGTGVGIRSIARGTVPLALFGSAGYAALLGRLALPVLLAQAAAPSVGAVLLQVIGGSGLLLVLLALAAVNVAIALPLRGWIGPVRL